MEEKTKEQHIARDLLNGCLSGAIGIYLTQPFDTVRIRMQVDRQLYPTIVSTFKRTYKQEGVKGFFKGSMSNINVGAAYYSILFAAKEYSERTLEPVTWLSENQKIYISGSFGGLCCVFVGTPLELFKCKAQVDTKKMTSYPQLIKNLYSENGIRSLYKGFWATFWRDVPIFGAFFFIYKFLTDTFIKPSDSEAVKHLKLVLISGLAGICNWVPTYPADLVKSIIQCHQGQETLTIRQVVREGYGRLGYKFFYSGISPTFLMAGPLHMLIMISYEKLSETMPEF